MLSHNAEKEAAALRDDARYHHERAPPSALFAESEIAPLMTRVNSYAQFDFIPIALSRTINSGGNRNMMA